MFLNAKDAQLVSSYSLSQTHQSQTHQSESQSERSSSQDDNRASFPASANGATQPTVPACKSVSLCACLSLCVCLSMFLSLHSVCGVVDTKPLLFLDNVTF